MIHKVSYANESDLIDENSDDIWDILDEPEKLNAKLAEIHIAIRKLKSELETCQKQRDKYRSQRNKFRLESLKLNTEVKEMEILKSKNQLQKTKKKLLNNTVSSLCEDNRKLKHKITLLEDEVSRKEGNIKVVAENEMLTLEIESLKSELEKVKSENDALKSFEERFERELINMNDEYEKVFAGFKDNTITPELFASSIQSGFTYDSMNVQYKLLKTKKDQLQFECIRLVSERDNLMSELEVVISKMKELEEENNRLKNKSHESPSPQPARLSEAQINEDGFLTVTNGDVHDRICCEIICVGEIIPV